MLTLRPVGLAFLATISVSANAQEMTRTKVGMSRVRLPVFDATIDPRMIDIISQDLVKYGIITRPVEPADLVR